MILYHRCTGHWHAEDKEAVWGATVMHCYYATKLSTPLAWRRHTYRTGVTLSTTVRLHSYYSNK